MRARRWIERGKARVRKDLQATCCRPLADLADRMMNFRPETPKPAGAGALANEPDFCLGPLTVSPSRLEVAAGGRSDGVQPRVMQVLVVLARANGAVVSRDELIRQCWGGQIVGDDAINRSVGKVRALADVCGKPAFEIETVPRVGYRLTTPTPVHVKEEAATTLAPVPLPKSQHSETPFKQTSVWRMGVGIFAILLSAALTGAIFFLVRQHGSRPRRWEVTQSDMIVSSSLRASWPAISPDGKTIAYSAGENSDSRHIYLRRMSGGPSLRLTSDNYDDSSPAWSSDGTQLAYIASRAGQPCRLMITEMLGGVSREIAACRTDERSAVAWSSSGKDLYFLDGGSTRSGDRIISLDLASGRRQQLTHSSNATLNDQTIAAAPDGTAIAFARDADSFKNDIRLLDLRTGRERSFGTLPAEFGSGIAWSGDARTLFVTTSTGPNSSVWSFSLDGQQPKEILSTPQSLGRLSFGPGKLLAVETHALHFGISRVWPGRRGEPALLAPEKSLDHTPDVTGHGTIAFAADRPDSAGIYVLPRNGSARLLMPLPKETIRYTVGRWSPTGSRLALGSSDETFTGIRLISANGAILATVPLHGKDWGYPEWTADGRSLTIPGNTGGGYRLWQVDLDHGNALHALPYSGWISVQRRGTELYGVRFDRPGVWTIDAHPRRLTPAPRPDRFIQWRVAGDNILYLDDQYSNHPRIMAQPIAGGPPHIYADVPRFAPWEGFAIDGSDGSIVYPSVRSFDQEIELLHLVSR